MTRFGPDPEAMRLTVSDWLLSAFRHWNRPSAVVGSTLMTPDSPKLDLRSMTPSARWNALRRS